HGRVVVNLLRPARAEHFALGSAAQSDLCRAVGTNIDPVNAAPRRADRNTRRADFDLRVGIAQHAETRGAGGDLNLIAVILQLAEANFARRTDAQQVGRIELHFGAPVGG